MKKISKSFLDILPNREIINSKIFKRIFTYFLFTVVILFAVSVIYFHFRIYRKELLEFMELTKKNIVFEEKFLNHILSDITVEMNYLRNNKDFLKALSAPLNKLNTELSYFIKNNPLIFNKFSLYKALIIVEKGKPIFYYQLDTNKGIVLPHKSILEKIKGKAIGEKRGLSLMYSLSSDPKKGCLFYYFRSGERDIYIKILFSNIIQYLSRYTSYNEDFNFIYTPDRELIYYKEPTKKLNIKWKSLIHIKKDISDSMFIEKKSFFIIVYIPFRIPPFEKSFLYVKVIPFYEVFKWKEYNIIIVLLLFFAVVLSIVFSTFILRQIVAPLQYLKEAVVSIAQGDFRRPLRISTHDEFEELTNAINVMARRIEDLYLNLEEKVKIRTEELEKQRYRLKKLYEVSFKFRDRERMLKTLLNYLLKILNADIGAISYKEGEWKYMEFIDKEERFSYKSGDKMGYHLLEEEVYESRKPLIIEDVLKDKRWEKVFTELGIRSYVGMPIFVDNNIYGILSISMRYPYRFSDQDLEIISLFIQRISYFLETELWEKRIIEKQRELEELNNLLYLKNEELMRLAEDLRQANKAKSNFLANVSHELRTPLNAILGFSEVLLEEYFGKLNEKQKEYVKNILESGKHLFSLINNILSLSKIEAGEESLRLVQVRLQDIIDSVVILVNEKAKKHNIKISIYHDEKIKDIVIDELKLKQALFNLLSNAIKFTHDGGKVGIVTKDLKMWYKISIWDTGIGIKKEDMGKLFKEFTQIENPYTKRYSGTGLGLALSKKLIEMLGGFITVTSVYKKGTTFNVFIPKDLSETGK